MAPNSGRPFKTSFLTPTRPVHNSYEKALCKTENISQAWVMWLLLLLLPVGALADGKPKSTRKRRFSQSRGEGRRSGHDFGPMFMRENAQLRARTLRTESRRILYNAPPSAPRDGVHGLAWPSLTAGEGNDATGLGWQIKHLPNLLHPGDGLFTGAEP